MEGKTCLITGGTDGIGKATAKGLAKLGATVVVLGRNSEKGEAAVLEIKTDSGSDKISFLACDLASQQSVREAADAFKATHGSLHVLINNAGVFLSKRTETVDGIESTFAINYLSHFLLTHLLLDLLKQSAPSRIINVASTHSGIKINFDDLMLKNGYSVTKAVGPTKLGMVLFTKALAKRLEGTGVTVNSLHPGLVKSGLLDDVNPLMRIALHLMSTTPEKGARTSIYLASSPDVQNVSGKFFSHSKMKETVGQANSLEAEEKLWNKSLELTKLKEF